jgi:hypothetical protein
MLRVYAVKMSAVANAGKNWIAFVDWVSESFGVKVALPRKTLGIPILDNK